MQPNTQNNNETRNNTEPRPEWNSPAIKNNPFDQNKGKIQEILKARPEIEEKRKANQSKAITLMNQAAHKYDAYYEYAEKTGFTEAWIDYVTEANVSDPEIQMGLGLELLKQHIITIGIGGYYEAKNGWVPDNILCRERAALIKFLLSDCELPSYPPRQYKTSLRRRRRG
ncbi:MAG: hypothetical protein UY21_C0010G0020 [Microgenomates group bacterium GW2011_GWA1_48_10]|nr:MAG: hypothetical protein UY21_C0010G0020 [Microgenomates group bacterium GW2011_GWA1_48_10]